MSSEYIVNPLSMNTARYYYSYFMEHYSQPHNYKGYNYTHSIPSSFVYNTIKDGCLWLLTLIMGVGGYSVYFDDDTTVSKVLSLGLLESAGVKDPALKYNSTLTPWVGLLYEGRSPLAPTDNVVSGLGLPYLNGEDLLPIYRADPLQAVLPEIDEKNNTIVYDDNGIMQLKKYSLCFTESDESDEAIENSVSINKSYSTSRNRFLFSNSMGNGHGIGSHSSESFEIYESPKIYPIYGWGMSYQTSVENAKSENKFCSLPLACVNDNTQQMCYRYSSQGIYCLKTKFAGKDVKYIGSNYGKPIYNTEYMTRLEATPFIEWAKYHLSIEEDSVYIPLYWMANYWAPFLSWRDGTQTNALQVIIMASSILTTKIIKKEDMQGKSLSAITTNFLKQSFSGKEKENLRYIVANTMRVISLLEFIKRY